MQILEVLDRRAFTAQKQFLVVEGHAINRYNVSRQTGDLDLAVLDTDLAWWRACLEELRYKLFHQTKSFAQFSPPEIGVWPIDLMLLNDKTFAGLINESVGFRFGPVECKVPALHHLIAMKLHAAKQQHEWRVNDLPDIVNLLRANNLTVDEPKIKAVFERFGTPDLYEEIKRRTS